MARYRGPKCKLSRGLGVDLENKLGAAKAKCKFDSAPGGSSMRRSRKSNYGTQLEMKQIIRNYYEIMEKQFHSYYVKASTMQGSTGINLLGLLERRLDNIVYRAGFAVTRSDARQMVSHRHITVNGKKVNIPSYLVSEGDVVAIAESSKGLDRVSFAVENFGSREEINWLDLDHKNLSGIIMNFPTVDDFPEYFKVNLVIEFYSK